MRHPRTQDARYTLTAETLRGLLDYDRATGVFTWLESPSKPTPWNRRYAGKRAGSVRRKDGRRIIKIKVEGKVRDYLASRLVVLWVTGEWPSQDADVDHRNLNKADDSWDNLRVSTHAQNQWNTKVQSRNRLGLKGVTFHPRDGGYYARIRADGKLYRLGRYRTPQEAYAAYCAAAARLHGEFARTA